MSERALCLAIRNRLRAAVVDGGLALAASECDVTALGQPHPRAGKRFCGIWGAGSTSSQECSLEESFAVDVVVSYRVNEPFDRIGSDTTYGLQIHALYGASLDVWADTIKALLVNKRWEIVSDANALINTAQGATVDGFKEPPFFRGQTLELVSGEWFHSTSQKECGLVRRLHFDGATRIQKIGGVT